MSVPRSAGIAVALWIAVAPHVARAQGAAAAESASVARAAWRRVSQSAQAGDLVTARREAERAVGAWPTQEAYVWGRAVLAAQAKDTAALLSALEAMANLGLGRDARAHPVIGPFAALPAFGAVTARLAANRAPLSQGVPRRTYADSTFWPEGVDYDRWTRSYFVAGIRHRTIVELPMTPGAHPRELLPRSQPGIGAILGVRVAPGGGVLYATTSGIPQMEGYLPADSGIAALLRIRIADGHIEHRWDLPPVPNGHTLGDLAIGPAGDVYLTDSNEPVLYRLRPGAAALEPIRHPLFRSLQGIAPTPDGGAVYVADYSHGLLRVDLATGAVTRLPDAPGSTSLGCDGITWYQGALIAVQNGVTPARIMRFGLSRDGLRIERADVLDRNTSLADEPTIGTMVGDEFVYVANSQWEKHNDAGARQPGAPLAPVLLIGVRVRP